MSQQNPAKRKSKFFSFFKHPVDATKTHAEAAARRRVLEELFYDMHASRAAVYKINFFRGVFFGLGSILGGTIVVAILIGILSAFTQLPGEAGDFVEDVINVVEDGR